MVEAGYDARSGHTAYGSVGGATFRHLGVDYTVTSLHGGGTLDLYFATTPNLPADGAGLTVHVQTYGGELDVPLAEGVFSSHNTLWFFQGALNTSASSGDTLSDAPMIHAPFGRDQVIPHPPDLGTKVRVRLSYFATGPDDGQAEDYGDGGCGQGTLTVDTSAISDLDGNTKAENGDAGFAYTYQWYRLDAGAETQITGATSNTYTLVGADADKTFRVEVRFTDDAGNSEGPLKSNEYPVGGENGELRLVDGPTDARRPPGGVPQRGSGARWSATTSGGRWRRASRARPIPIAVWDGARVRTTGGGAALGRGNIARRRTQEACRFMGYATRREVAWNRARTPHAPGRRPRRSSPDLARRRAVF